MSKDYEAIMDSMVYDKLIKIFSKYPTSIQDTIMHIISIRLRELYASIDEFPEDVLNPSKEDYDMLVAKAEQYDYDINHKYSLSEQIALLNNIYQIYSRRGSIDSIENMWKYYGGNLPKEVEVTIPAYDIFRYSVSALSGTHRFQDDLYYRAGVYTINIEGNYDVSEIRDFVVNELVAAGTNVNFHKINSMDFSSGNATMMADTVYKATTVYMDMLVALNRTGLTWSAHSPKMTWSGSLNLLISITVLLTLDLNIPFTIESDRGFKYDHKKDIYAALQLPLNHYKSTTLYKQLSNYFNTLIHADPRVQKAIWLIDNYSTGEYPSHLSHNFWNFYRSDLISNIDYAELLMKNSVLSDNRYYINTTAFNQYFINAYTNELRNQYLHREPIYNTITHTITEQDFPETTASVFKIAQFDTDQSLDGITYVARFDHASVTINGEAYHPTPFGEKIKILCSNGSMTQIITTYKFNTKKMSFSGIVVFVNKDNTGMLRITGSGVIQLNKYAPELKAGDVVSVTVPYYPSYNYELIFPYEDWKYQYCDHIANLVYNKFGVPTDAFKATLAEVNMLTSNISDRVYSNNLITVLLLNDIQRDTGSKTISKRIVLEEYTDDRTYYYGGQTTYKNVLPMVVDSCGKRYLLNADKLVVKAHGGGVLYNSQGVEYHLLTKDLKLESKFLIDSHFYRYFYPTPITYDEDGTIHDGLTLYFVDKSETRILWFYIDGDDINLVVPRSEHTNWDLCGYPEGFVFTITAEYDPVESYDNLGSDVFTYEDWLFTYCDKLVNTILADFDIPDDVPYSSDTYKIDITTKNISNLAYKATRLLRWLDEADLGKILLNIINPEDVNILKDRLTIGTFDLPMSITSDELRVLDIYAKSVIKAYVSDVLDKFLGNVELNSYIPGDTDTQWDRLTIGTFDLPMSITSDELRVLNTYAKSILNTYVSNTLDKFIGNIELSTYIAGDFDTQWDHLTIGNFNITLNLYEEISKNIYYWIDSSGSTTTEYLMNQYMLPEEGTTSVLTKYKYGESEFDGTGVLSTNSSTALVGPRSGDVTSIISVEVHDPSRCGEDEWIPMVEIPYNETITIYNADKSSSYSLTSKNYFLPTGGLRYSYGYIYYYIPDDTGDWYNCHAYINLNSSSATSTTKDDIKIYFQCSTPSSTEGFTRNTTFRVRYNFRKAYQVDADYFKGVYNVIDSWLPFITKSILTSNSSDWTNSSSTLYNLLYTDLCYSSSSDERYVDIHYYNRNQEEILPDDTYPSVFVLGKTLLGTIYL